MVNRKYYQVRPNFTIKQTLENLYTKKTFYSETNGQKITHSKNMHFVLQYQNIGPSFKMSPKNK